ncbi:MAG: Carbohydrate kinase, YjeF related protein [Clostridia bacterium 62_21]|nr:MAG: Carbohydrate kinase, YjeF related protein [Clostridia bacterium 62_21]
MRLVTAQEMREIDRAAIESHRIPGLLLMENAGRAVCQAVCDLLGTLKGKVVFVLAGKGNNGGDGFVAARHLLNGGAHVRVMLATEPDKVTGDARVNLDIWLCLGQKLYFLSDRNALQVLQLGLMQADAVIDALYGTGFRGVIRDRPAKAVETVNQSGRPVVAVDIPSGVEADTGKVHGPAIRATRTVTFGLPKLGLVLEPGASYAGEITVADISLPRALLEGGRRFLLTRELVASWLPRRAPEAHKGIFGHVLVVGGSRGMVGAACMAAMAALRVGAGLVTLAVPRSLQDVAASKVTEAMTLGLPEGQEGHLGRTARDEIVHFLKRSGAVLALGPVLGVHPETTALVCELLAEAEAPCVVDADGLNALAAAMHAEGSRESAAADAGVISLPVRPLGRLVLTPHPGEMARLLGVSSKEVQDDRLGTAERTAAGWNCTVVLKGARTVVAAPDGTTYVNATGNPGMATGGSGDVLTGAVAGLLAQGLEPVRAAAAAVYLHGRAGDLAAETKGQPGLIAGDILDRLPEAIKEIAQPSGGIENI